MSFSIVTIVGFALGLCTSALFFGILYQNPNWRRVWTEFYRSAKGKPDEPFPVYFYLCDTLLVSSLFFWIGADGTTKYWQLLGMAFVFCPLWSLFLSNHRSRSFMLKQFSDNYWQLNLMTAGIEFFSLVFGLLVFTFFAA
jgi:hypothetical protein